MRDETEASDSLMQTLRRGFGFCAFVGFGVSLVVHLLTFLGLGISERLPWVWALHFGIFVFGVPMIFSSINRGDKREQLRRYFAPLPLWARYVVRGLFVYTIINFIIFMALTHEGSAVIQDGKYVLRSGGRLEERRVIREISKEEYDLQNDRTLRGFSGHWMFFYLIPSLYFWYPRRDEREEEA